MKTFNCLFASALVGCVVAARNMNVFKAGISKTEKERVAEIKQKYLSQNEAGSGPTELWFDANIDNFTNRGAGSPTYKMRYLVDTTYVDETSDETPIIFYAGNEGDVWTFWDNSGFMTTTLAEQFGAMVVFGEHRYYGESMPFGDETFERDNLKYLTVEQAMEDYVNFMFWFRETHQMQDRAVIVGGGSYGGMLSAWLRMKYPHVF